MDWICKKTWIEKLTLKNLGKLFKVNDVWKFKIRLKQLSFTREQHMNSL